MNFYGAIYDQVGCFGGGTAYLTNKGLLENCCNDSECPYFQKIKSTASTIKAVWCEEEGEEFAWTYKTSIPHETFEILDDGDKFCKGIVFALDDVKLSSMNREL